jgi:hypothetical protein
VTARSPRTSAAMPHASYLRGRWARGRGVSNRGVLLVKPMLPPVRRVTATCHGMAKPDTAKQDGQSPGGGGFGSGRAVSLSHRLLWLARPRIRSLKSAVCSPSPASRPPPPCLAFSLPPSRRLRSPRRPRATPCPRIPSLSRVRHVTAKPAGRRVLTRPAGYRSVGLFHRHGPAKLCPSPACGLSGRSRRRSLKPRGRVPSGREGGTGNGRAPPRLTATAPLSCSLPPSLACMSRRSAAKPAGRRVLTRPAGSGSVRLFHRHDPAELCPSPACKAAGEGAQSAGGGHFGSGRAVRPSHRLL